MEGFGSGTSVEFFYSGDELRVTRGSKPCFRSFCLLFFLFVTTAVESVAAALVGGVAEGDMFLVLDRNWVGEGEREDAFVFSLLIWCEAVGRLVSFGMEGPWR